MKKRMYVLIIDSPELTDAHKEVLKKVQAYSDGDFINLFSRAGEKRSTGRTTFAIPVVTVYLFTSELRCDQLRIPGATGDRHVLLELGDGAWFEGYSRARAWCEDRRKTLLLERSVMP